jgi:hypothetical protein
LLDLAKFIELSTSIKFNKIFESIYINPYINNKELILAQ